MILRTTTRWFQNWFLFVLRLSAQRNRLFPCRADCLFLFSYWRENCWLWSITSCYVTHKYYKQDRLNILDSCNEWQCWWGKWRSLTVDAYQWVSWNSPVLTVWLQTKIYNYFLFAGTSIMVNLSTLVLTLISMM